MASFNSKDNVNTLYRFFLNLADSLLQKSSRPKNKIRIKTSELYADRK